MKPASKILVATAFSFLCLVFSLTLNAQKTNFSGTWSFNESKSQMGEGRFRMAPSKMTISQDNTVLTIESTRTRQSGETMTINEAYTLDGQECDNSNPDQGRTKKSTVTFSADGKVMTITSKTTMERNGNKMEMQSVENYKLSDDGKTLTIETSSTSPRGEFKTTPVYDKQ